MKITELLSVPAAEAVGGDWRSDQRDDIEMRDTSEHQHQQQQQQLVVNSHTPPQQQRRMDMASLDLFARQKQQPRENLQRSKVQDLSMNRIIQELQSGGQLIAPPTQQQQIPVETLKHPIKDDESPSSSALAAAAMLSFTQISSHEQPQRVETVSRTSSDRSQAPVMAAADKPHKTKSTKKSTAKPKQQTWASSSKKSSAGQGDSAVAATDEVEDRDQEGDAGDGEDTGGAQRRRTRNGFAPLTESEKRVKQRQLVKRSYYRKIDTINELREVAEKLEDEFQAVLDGRRKYSAQHQLELSPFEALREKYTQLAISKDDLRMENEALRATAAEQSKARTRVSILVDEELREQEEVARVAGIIPFSERAASLITSTQLGHCDPVKPVLAIKPISRTECMDIVKDAYGHIMEFREAQNYVTTGASVFGWRDRRKVEGDTMKFFLEKTFPCSAEQVATTMWGILSTEAGVNRIYNSDIAIKFHLVQRVDDNNVVFYRTIEREGQNVIIKSLVLGSLVQIETGFLLLFRSLDPTQRLLAEGEKASNSEPQTSLSPFVREKREIWSDVFSWGLYEHAEGNQDYCRNSFGGFVPSSTATTLEFWLMHILIIAVRCENEAIGPVFVLPSSE